MHEALTPQVDHALRSMVLGYQPIVTPEGGIYATEVLPTFDGGFADMEALLGAAKLVGRFYDVGRRLRAQVAADLELLPEDKWVFVPVHPMELLDPALVNGRDPLVDQAHRVVLELKGYCDLPAGAEQAIAKLRQLGYLIAVDDLLGSHEDLRRVKELNPDFAKLDAELVHAVEDTPWCRRFLRRVAEHCGAAQIPMLAQGVDSPELRSLVLQSGCALFQGELFGQAEFLQSPHERVQLLA